MIPSPLFMLDALETAFVWICKLRKEYADSSDIWELRRNWGSIKHNLLKQLNNGSYQFSILNRYEIEGVCISLWSAQDMIVLKLMSQTLQEKMGDNIPKTCYHVKGHGGLKKAVQNTHAALSDYRHVMRSDIKGYYASINFESLISIIESYVKHPVLIRLLIKACNRCETRGGIFYDYNENGIPMGSPLSPILAAIALIPLDLAMGKIQNTFYCRFMDDWLVLTKSKTALRKVIKITHEVLKDLKLQLHPTKTYIGRISHGFNFLAYYMDDKKILPSKETIRRFHERSVALYEQSQLTSKPPQRYKKNTATNRDISVYQVDEEAPTEEYFQNILRALWELIILKPETLAFLRRYLGRWSRWLKCGLSTIIEFERNVQTLLPSISSCWIKDSHIFT